MDRRVELVELELPNGGVIFAEVEVPSGGDAAFGTRGRFSLEDVRANVVDLGSWVLDTVRAGLPEKPARIGVEFGLKLTAKTGPLVAALAEAEGEASVVVKLEWSQPREHAPGHPTGGDQQD